MFSGIEDGGVKTVNFTTSYNHCKVSIKNFRFIEIKIVTLATSEVQKRDNPVAPIE